MSFLIDVKEEILYIDNGKKHCYIAEMHSILNQNFKINVSKKISLSIISENYYVVSRFSFLMKIYFKEPFDMKVVKSNNTKRPYIYYIYIHDAKSFLEKNLMFINNTFVFNSEKITSKKCCKAAYIRGEFFKGGAFSNPEKNYHLEFKKNDEKSAKKLQKMLNSFDLNAKVIKRKSYNIVYIKEVDKISDCLTLIGAFNQMLHLESLFVLKNMKNNINRKQNCEMANLSKTITASVKQIRDINLVYQTYGKNYLDDDIVEVCDLRLNFEDLSLLEIGKMCNPQISKSSVNYKLKKVSNIAENLRSESL